MSLAGGFLGWQINSQKTEALSGKAAAEQQLDTTKKTLGKVQEDLKQTKSSLDDTKGQLTTAQQSVEQTKRDLAAAQAKATELETKATDAQSKATAAQSQLDDVKKQVSQQSDATKAAEAKVADLDKAKRVAEDALAKQKAEVDRLSDILKRRVTGDMPPGISGKIVSVNRNWNFVVLNIGDKQGVVENGELIVSRNKSVIGRIRVTSTNGDTAVADILVNTLKDPSLQLQPGDDVQN
ncbi:hypothetical protein [Verrucomicrobium sp. GAS474]|uniref:hypothetical protein n=1 Tax=Verrucomicrobium sp. GAS474 TaxID=1882831 RepID=UPI000B8377EA|nr:hypothetical protein [Verrucomicrobium sp. GAS474]